jgi:sulfotransferase 6B1
MTDKPDPVLVVSMPKAGTNLMIKLLGLFPGLQFTNFQIGRPDLQKYLDESSHNPGAGGDWGLRFPEHSPIVRNVLAMIGPGQFSTTHLAPNPHFVDLVRDARLKLMLMIRDPRDVIVSHAHYVLSKDQHPLHVYYRNLDWEQRLRISITGCSAAQSGTRALKPMAARFKAFLSWMDFADVLCVRFEQLVGAAGGGSDDEQQITVKKVAEHVGITLTPVQLERIRKDLFGNSPTFRRGVIGGWKTELNTEHKRLINESMGALLVKTGYASDLGSAQDVSRGSRRVPARSRSAR